MQLVRIVTSAVAKRDPSVKSLLD